MSINKNLKDLRTSRGMTQEEVAQKIGLTRQAISSYESGRTRPDIEMLMRLAEAYETDLDSILYGQSKAQKAVRAVKIAAIVTLVVILLMTLAASLLLWITNHFFALQSGQTISEDMMPVWDMRLALMGARMLVERATLIVSVICFAVLLVLLCQVEHPIPVRYKLGYVVILAVGLAAVTVPFAITDPVYALTDYRLEPTYTLAKALIFLAASIVIDLVRKRWMKNRKKQEA